MIKVGTILARYKNGQKSEVDKMRNFEQVLEKTANMPSLTVAVAVAEDPEVIESVRLAISKNLAQFILFGDEDKIKSMMVDHSLKSASEVKVINAENEQTAAMMAVKAVHQGEANIVMKGNLPTSTILKAVLNKEWGLRTGNVLSHVALFEVPGYERLIYLTDAAMNIAPSLEQKAQIIENAVGVAKKLGVTYPKVAALAAIETVNPNMQATIDAAALTTLNREGTIAGCVVDGPLALDNAISIKAAKHKNIQSDVAGEADILVTPTIEVGNALYKSLMYFANAKVGAVIAGATAPIILTSRADSAESKLHSLAVAALVARGE